MTPPPATRTQIYLTDAQRRRLDEICRTRNLSLAEAVREAVDAWLEHRHTSCTDALDATWGTAPRAEVPSRDEWDRAPAPTPGADERGRRTRPDGATQ
jgi:hypothetical protein